MYGNQELGCVCVWESGVRVCVCGTQELGSVWGYGTQELGCVWVWESSVKKKVSVIVRNFTFFTVSISITFIGVMMSSKQPLAQSPKSSLSPPTPTTPANPEHTYSTAGTWRLLAPFLASRASFSVMSLSRERLARDGLGQ